MRINNASEFFEFMRIRGLIHISPEVTAFAVCMDELGRLCPCDPENVRVGKYNQCKSFYIAFIQNIGQHKNTILSKTAEDSIILCTDGQYLTTVSRA